MYECLDIGRCYNIAKVRAFVTKQAKQERIDGDVKNNNNQQLLELGRAKLQLHDYLLLLQFLCQNFTSLCCIISPLYKFFTNENIPYTYIHTYIHIYIYLYICSRKSIKKDRLLPKIYKNEIDNAIVTLNKFRDIFLILIITY